MYNKKCPGYYCGIYDSSTNCSACPRGWRTQIDHDLCEPCTNDPTFYDILYMICMAALPLFYHWYYIDYQISNVELRKKLVLSAVFETLVATTLTVLIMEPMWTFKIYSCDIYSLSDWYTFIFNPTPNYETSIHCTQEVVYPLYTMVFVYYTFGVLSLLLIRPWFTEFKRFDCGTAAFYAGLYLFPILAVVHAVFCGFIYYMFPYIVIIVSVVSNAIHFARKLNQSMGYLIKDTFASTRNLFIVCIHWCCHAFGIIGITQLKEPSMHYPLLLLVPVPTLFYIVTSRLTDPRKLHGD